MLSEYEICRQEIKHWSAYSRTAFRDMDMAVEGRYNLSRMQDEHKDTMPQGFCSVFVSRVFVWGVS